MKEKHLVSLTQSAENQLKDIREATIRRFDFSQMLASFCKDHLRSQRSSSDGKKTRVYENAVDKAFNELLEDITDSDIIADAIAYRLAHDPDLVFDDDEDGSQVNLMVDEILKDSIIGQIEAEIENISDDGDGFARCQLDIEFCSEEFVDNLVDWNDDEAIGKFLKGHFDTDTGLFRYSDTVYIWENYSIEFSVELDHIPSKVELENEVKKAVYSDLPDYPRFNIPELIERIDDSIRSFRA